jgi:hypothetical protein
MTLVLCRHWLIYAIGAVYRTRLPTIGPDATVINLLATHHAKDERSRPSLGIVYLPDGF